MGVMNRMMEFMIGRISKKEERKDIMGKWMLSMCREVLDEMEKKYLLQEASPPNLPEEDPNLFLAFLIPQVIPESYSSQKLFSCP